MATSKGEYTRSGARRSGDDYQDLVAIEVLVDWLEHPDRFRWVKVEGDDLGALDDVVALADDGTLHSRQVKFSTAPDDADDNYTWDDLLDQEAGAKGKLKTSLLQKWRDGLEKAKGLAAACDARIVSNRKGGSALLASMVDGWVQTDRVPADVHERVVRQLGSSEEAKSFFDSVQFSLDYPSYEDLEVRLIRKFFTLGGTEQGWLDLKDHVRAWVRKRHQPPPDGTIRLTHVRSAAGWRELRWLPQEFEVPDDYILPSQRAHDELLARLSNADQGCVLIEAPPGYGKSTYASFLFDDLLKRNVPAVRHHYFLSMNDRKGYDRLESDRAAESLLFDLRTRYPEAVGGLGATNLKPEQLGEALDTCARHFEAKATPLVVIVDGLDHVWRERRSVGELERLLRHLLPVRHGVVVLLVSQPVPEPLMPPLLRRALSQTARTQMALLDQPAVEQWTLKRRDLLGLAGDDSLTSFVDALLKKTQGHPLLLRYVFRTLEARGVTPTIAEVESLPGCVHADVTSYYANLVASLPTASVGVLHLIAACPFHWPIDGIVHCLASAGLSDPQARDALQGISHLLLKETLGLRPFHASLAVFIAAREDHVNEASLWRPRALSWLQSSAPDCWRWAYEWMVEADAGNATPLADGPDRAWVVEAIRKRRPKHQMLAILGRSAWFCLAEKKLGRAVQVGLLREYAANAFEDDRGVLPILLPCQLALGEDPALAVRLLAGLEELSGAELLELARSAAIRRIAGTPERVLAELCRDYRRPEQREPFDLYVEQLAEVTGLVENPDMDRAVSAGTSLRAYRASVTFFSAFVRGLSRKGNVNAMRELAAQAPTMSAAEGQVVMRGAAVLGLKQSANMDDFVLSPSALGVPEAIFYCAARGLSTAEHKACKLPEPARLRYEELSRMRPSAAALGKEVAYVLVANHLMKAATANREWINALEGAWQKSFFSSLDLACEQLASLLTARRPLSLAAFFRHFEALPQVDAAEDGKFYAKLFASQAARGLILFAAELCAIWPNTVEAVAPDTIAALSSSLFNVFAWLDAAAQYPGLVTKAAMTWLIDSDQKQPFGESFAERAETSASLAKLALAHNDTAACRGLVLRAAQRLLAHGYHKDMLLFGPLELAQQCYDADVGHPWHWLCSLASAIAMIDKVTDSDETGHLPAHLAAAVARVSPQHLPAYYRALCGEEDWDTALAALRRIIEVLDLSTPEASALAETALDVRSLALVASLAPNNPAAFAVKGKVEQMFGPDAFRPDEDESATKEPEALGADARQIETAPATYPPGTFESFLKGSDVGARPNRTIAVEAWLTHWAEQGRGQEALADVGRVMDASPWSGLGDTVYQVVLRQNGKDAAFSWLVRAQREGRGWDAYFTSKEVTQKRWDEVARLYPNRWYEFLRESLISETDEPWKAQLLNSWRLERVGEYLLRFDRNGCAAEFASAAVEAAIELMPLTLTRPSWLDEPVSGSVPLSLLIERLAWPSGLARERAANGIAQLLAKVETRAATQKALLEWMRRQGLESVQSYGLVCFVRARDLGGAAVLPDPAELRPALTAPSLLSSIHLADLGPKYEALAPQFAPESGSVPSGFSPEPFFEKHRQSFAPPFFSNWAERLETRTLFPFRAQWAFEWSQIVDRERITRSTNSARYWFAPEDKETIIFDVPMSEAYRSSYLRALARLTRVGLMPGDAAVMLAADVCPVDFSLWNVRPTRKPHDWPSPSPSTSALVDLGPEAVWESIEKWWESQTHHPMVLTYANGRVLEGEAIFDLELWGAFQRCTGPTPASAEEAFDELTTREASTMVNNLLRLNGTVRTPQPDRLAVQCGDSEYLPAATSLRPSGIPRWQAWRHFRGWAAPSQTLFDGGQGLSCACFHDRVEFSSEGRVVGTWSDWTERVRERGNRHVGPFNGCSLRSPRTAIDAFAERNDAAFCWVCRVTAYYGKSYSRRKEATHSTRQFGGTSIIRPGSWRLVGV